MPHVEIYVEKDALQRIPEISRKLGLGKNCLVVDDINTRKVAGNRIVDLLNHEGCNVSEVIVDRPDEANVQRVVASAGRDVFFVGVGGTSVLDITKLAAYRKSARYILFSTGIANNGISSKTSSVCVGGKKEMIPVNLADAIMVDMGIISSAPSWMVTAGCGDLVAEVTAIKDWQLGRDKSIESYCHSVAELELSALNDVMNNADAIRSRTDGGIRSLVDALIRSGLGMSIWGSSRPSSGSEHLWSHWLDQYAEENKMKFGQHGEQVGIGTLLMAKYHELYNPDWWSRTQYPNYQAETVMSFLRKVGAYTTPAEIGVKKELATQAFLDAWKYRKERYTILHERHPTSEDVEKVMRQLDL
jgi:glycerol-1-phosphate dehydrogenase [NAD(P)+]